MSARLTATGGPCPNGVQMTRSAAVSLDFVLAQLPALMQLIADGRVWVQARTAPLPQIAQARTAVRNSASRVVVPGWRLCLPPAGLVTAGH
jgi:hypothetical protein